MKFQQTYYVCIFIHGCIGWCIRESSSPNCESAQFKLTLLPPLNLLRSIKVLVDLHCDYTPLQRTTFCQCSNTVHALSSCSVVSCKQVYVHLSFTNVDFTYVSSWFRCVYRSFLSFAFS